MEERIEKLEEDHVQQQAESRTLLGIVQGIDAKMGELTGAVRSVQAHEAIIDARLNTLDARLAAEHTRIDTLHLDMQRSFQQAAATMATREDLAELTQRMNAVESRIGTVDSKIDQVLSLLKKQGE